MIKQDNGFILKSTPLKEDDAIITILTQKSGKLEVYAKHIKSTKSKRKSAVEILNYVNFTYREGKSSKQLPFLGEMKLLNNFQVLKHPDHLFAESFLLAEVLNKLIIEEDDPYIFNLLFELSQATKSNEHSLQVFNFAILKILDYLGFIPELNKCLKTGETFSEKSRVIVAYDSPGYYINQEAQANPQLIRIIRVQNYIIKKDTEILDFLKVKLEPEELRQLTDINLNWTETILEKELKSKYLLQWLKN